MLFWGGVALVLCGGFQSASLQLSDSGVDESSGVCWSDESELLWTHNDSGGQPRVFAFDESGKKRAEVKIRGAEAIDWEDICLFTRDGKNYLAIGDVGDNRAQRSFVRVYIVSESELLTAQKDGRSAKPQATLRIQYEGGAVNCESLAYDPREEALLLISKQPFYSQVYQVDVANISGNQERTAAKTQRLVVPLATGADISPDGRHLVISTYGPAMLFERRGERWRACEEPALEVPARKQGESICFARGKSKLILTSEFAPAALIFVDVPDAIARQ